MVSKLISSPYFEMDTVKNQNFLEVSVLLVRAGKFDIIIIKHKEYASFVYLV